MMNVTKIGSPSIQELNRVTGEGKAQNIASQAGSTFRDALDSLSSRQEYSDNLIQKLATGEDVDLHQVMIASEETDINFRVAIAIRDKLVEAYREVMRIAV